MEQYSINNTKDSRHGHETVSSDFPQKNMDFLEQQNKNPEQRQEDSLQKHTDLLPSMKKDSINESKYLRHGYEIGLSDDPKETKQLKIDMDQGQADFSERIKQSQTL